MRKEQESSVIWISLSAGIHLIILAIFFVSLVQKPSLIAPPQKKLFAFKVPAPVLFYGQTMDPQKKPGSPEHNVTLSPTKGKTTQKEKVSQKDATIKQQTNVQKSTPPPSQTKPSKKEPTLANIFNNARKHFSTKPIKTDHKAPGDGAGQQLVIREGDLKYYSLWSSFLKHLNNAAQFNRVQNPVPIEQWLRTKKITQNMQCGITINKKGEVLSVDITASSGYPPFDELCIQDIWSASPFPPLPDHLEKSQARFEVKSYI